jgi:hypothetical protein
MNRTVLKVGLAAFLLLAIFPPVQSRSTRTGRISSLGHYFILGLPRGTYDMDFPVDYGRFGLFAFAILVGTALGAYAFKAVEQPGRAEPQSRIPPASG